MRWMAGLAVVIGVMALVGCAPRVELPPGPTRAEMEAIAARDSADSWHLIYPDREAPIVMGTKYLTPQQRAAAVQQCMSEGITSGTPQLTQWVCNQRFPVDYLAKEFARYILSPAQLEYVYDYFEERLVPCLRMSGFTITQQQDHDTFMAESIGWPSWNPYSYVSPAPASEKDWAAVVARCPPPPFAPLLSPTKWFDATVKP